MNDLKKLLGLGLHVADLLVKQGIAGKRPSRKRKKQRRGRKKKQVTPIAERMAPIQAWATVQQKIIQLRKVQAKVADPAEWWYLQEQLHHWGKKGKGLQGKVSYQMHFISPARVLTHLQRGNSADSYYCAALMAGMGLRRNANKQRAYWLQTVAADPAHLPALWQLSHHYFGIKNYGESERCLQQLITHYPRFGAAYLMYGRLMVALEREHDATNYWRKAVELQVPNQSFYVEAAQYWFEHNRFEPLIEVLVMGEYLYPNDRKLQKVTEELRSRLPAQQQQHLEERFTNKKVIRRSQLLPLWRDRNLYGDEEMLVGSVMWRANKLYQGDPLRPIDVAIHFQPLCASIIALSWHFVDDGRTITVDLAASLTRRFWVQMADPETDLYPLLQYGGGVSRIQAFLQLLLELITVVVEEKTGERDEDKVDEVGYKLLKRLRKIGGRPFGKGVYHQDDQEWFKEWWRKKKISRDAQYAETGSWSGYVGGGFASSSKDPDDWEHPYTK